MNEELAFVSIDNEDSFDVKSAAIDLLRVKTWKHLVGFLQKHGTNRAVAWLIYDNTKDRCLLEYGRPEFQMIFKGGAAYRFDWEELGKPLPAVLSKPDMPDYIDNVKGMPYIDDLPNPIAVVNIRELIHLRDSLRGLVRLACVATGHEYPPGLISLVPVDEVFVVAGIKTDMAGYYHHGLFDTQDVANLEYENLGSFGLKDGDSTHQQLYEKLCEIKYSFFEQGCFSFVFSRKEQSDREAIRAICGTLAANSMDLIGIGGSADNMCLYLPDHDQPDETLVGRYSFSLEYGFRYNEIPNYSVWWMEIADCVLNAIIDGHITICENCSIPFISKRTTRNTCSDSCRMELSLKKKYGQLAR